MKILQVIHCFPPESMTGSEIYAYNLAKELSKRHEISVFYRVNNPKYKEYEIIKGTYDGLYVYKINNTLRGYNTEKIYKNKDIESKFIEILEEVKPDIVHIHHLLFLSTGIISEIKKRHIPIIFTLHDYWMLCPKGQLLRNNMRVCKNPLNSNCFYCLAMSLNIKSLFKRLHNFSFRFNKPSEKGSVKLRGIYDGVDLFISPSRFLRDKFIKFGIPSEKIIHSDNGLNLSLFKDAGKTKSDKIRFGFIGTFIPSKGVHVIIRAFNSIKGNRAVLKIYGKSPVNNGFFDYFHRMNMLAAGNKNIKFMGMFDNNQVASVFKEIDVLIFPSIWEENSPLVLHEAILTKTPVLASDIGGVPELIKNGENGFLFNPGDYRNLYRGMMDIIESPSIVKGIRYNNSIIKNIVDNGVEMEDMYVKELNK